MTKYNAKQMAEKLENIRRENVKRHTTAAAAAVSKLRREIQAHRMQRNKQMELDRLHEASTRPNGLNQVGFNRMTEIRKVIK